MLPPSTRDDEGANFEQTFQIAHITESSHPYKTDIEINGKRVITEIDTGASVSIISVRQQTRIFPDAVIKKSPLQLQTYTGEAISVVGQMQANVR